MVLRKLAVALIGAGVLLPGLSKALVLGEEVLKSSLYEPLVAEVELQSLGDLSADEIKVSLGNQEDFDRGGMAREFYLTDFRYDVTVNPDGRSFIAITSRKPIREPALDFLIRVQWPSGTQVKSITLLLDPPVDTSTAIKPVSDVVPPQASTAPVVASTQVDVTPQVEVVAAPPVMAPVAAPDPARMEAARRAAAANFQTAAPEPVSAPGVDEYKVKNGDTLWAIALRVKPQGVTAQQAMMSIKKQNPDAFAGSINVLKPGKILRIPDAEFMKSMSSTQAARAVAQDVQAEPAQISAVARPAAPVDTGKKEAQMRLVTPSGDAKKATGKAGGDAAAVKKLAVAEEEVDRFKRANVDLGSRVSDLEKQVKTSDSLIKLKDGQIAELQAQLKKPGTKPVEPSAPVAAPLAEAAPVPAVTGATTSGVATAPAAAVPAVAAEKLAANPVAVAVPAAEPEAPAIPLWQMAAGGLLAVLLGGGALLYLRKRKTADDADLGDADVSGDDMVMAADDEPDSFALNLGADDDDDGPYLLGGDDPVVSNDLSAGDALSDLDNLDLGFEDAEPAATAVAAPAASDSDPLQEAEVYVAYGRLPQAIGILVKGAASFPERTDIRLKLLELYAKTQDVEGFAEQETAVSDKLNIAEAEQLASWKAMLPLVKAAAGKDDSIEFDLGDFSMGDAAPAAEAASAISGDDLGLDDLGLDFASVDEPTTNSLSANDVSADDLGLDFSAMDSFSTKSAADEPPAATTSMDLGEFSGDDLSLDFATDMSLTDTSATDATVVDMPALDLSAADDVQFTATADADTAVDFAEFSLDVAEPATATDDMTSLSFKLDDELTEFAAAPVEDRASAGKRTMGEDLDFSLDDFATEDVALALPETDEVAGDLSDDSFSLDINSGHQSALEDAAAEFDLALADEAPVAALDEFELDESMADELALDAPAAAEASPALDEDDFSFLGDQDENVTKLDLARAYIDMGDSDGARDILNEVMAEGNDVQQSEARQLLAQVG